MVHVVEKASAAVDNGREAAASYLVARVSFYSSANILQ